ncbi:MAG: YraN family protein [Deltaproteobacteria bacterium]|nr:YraN family protein [Deltaproteobacteria bacterium]
MAFTQRNDERSNPVLSEEIRRRYPQGWPELKLSPEDIFIAIEESSLRMNPRDRNFPWNGLRFILSNLITPDFSAFLNQLQNPRLTGGEVGKLKFKNPFFRLGSHQIQILADSLENLLSSIRSKQNPITEENLNEAFAGVRGILESHRGAEALKNLNDLIDEFTVASYLSENGFTILKMRQKFRDAKSGEAGEIDILAKDPYGNLVIVEVKSSLRHYTTGKRPQVVRYENILREGVARIGLDVKEVIVFVSGGFNNREVSDFRKNHGDARFKFMEFSKKSGLRKAS